MRNSNTLSFKQLVYMFTCIKYLSIYNYRALLNYLQTLMKILMLIEKTNSSLDCFVL